MPRKKKQQPQAPPAPIDEDLMKKIQRATASYLKDKNAKPKESKGRKITGVITHEGGKTTISFKKR